MVLLVVVSMLVASNMGFVHIAELKGPGPESPSGVNLVALPYKMSIRRGGDGPLSADKLLPGTTGLKNPLMCLTQARYGIAWGVIGSAMATFTAALDYAKNRIQFGGRPIAAQQIIQQRLVWMYNEIVKAQLLALQLGRMKDAGTMTHEAVSLAKRNNVWVARECAKLAREIHGANGIVNEYPIMRHLMNIESVYTYEGTHDVHTLVLGNYLTGIPAFDPAIPDTD